VKNVVLLLASVLLALISSGSYAKNTDELLLNLMGCSTIPSSDERLACFDKLVTNSATPSVMATTVVAPSLTDKKLTKQKQVDDFAKEHVKKTKKEQGPSSIFATVSKVKQLLRGQWVLDFENGQKWQQTGTTRAKFKVGNKVRFDKTAMGAIYLYKDGSHRSIKVKRLK
jgi:hypothetical protein